MVALTVLSYWRSPRLREAACHAQGHTAWEELGALSRIAPQMSHLHPCKTPPVTPLEVKPAGPSLPPSRCCAPMSGGLWGTRTFAGQKNISLDLTCSSGCCPRGPLGSNPLGPVWGHPRSLAGLTGLPELSQQLQAGRMPRPQCLWALSPGRRPICGWHRSFGLGWEHHRDFKNKGP